MNGFKLKTLLALSILLFITVFSGCHQTDSPAATTAPIETPSITSANTAKHSLVPAEYNKPVPVQISFNKLGITVPITPVGINEKGEMVTPDAGDVASWYRFGASPGQQGNAIFAGHAEWDGEKGLFSVLPDLAAGESVEVKYEDGTQKVFHVVSNEIYMLDGIPPWVMSLKGEARVTLITCSGDYIPSIGTAEARCVVICKE